MSLRIVMSFLAATLAVGCDDDRTAELALLADPDLDPEIRAEIEAELAAAGDDDAREPAADAADALAAPAPDPSAGTCFFCQPPPADPATWTPVVINPYVSTNAQGNTILFMSAASSYIATGATVRLQVPWSTQTYGPYALSFTDSGTQFRANVTGAFPAGSCRMITVTNPNGKTSSPVTHCR